MNRAAVMEALGLATDLGVEDRSISLDSAMGREPSNQVRIALWFAMSPNAVEPLKALATPKVKWYGTQRIAEFTIGNVRVEYWDWPEPAEGETCPACKRPTADAPVPTGAGA